MKRYRFSTGGVPQNILTNSTPCWPSEATTAPPAGRAVQQQHPLLAERCNTLTADHSQTSFPLTWTKPEAFTRTATWKKLPMFESQLASSGELSCNDD